MNTEPSLSIIIPTHNRSEMLIQSLKALTRQTLPKDLFEIIVVADACEDDTAERVHQFQKTTGHSLQFFSQNARNAGATRNFGATRAKGEYLLFLDDDIIPDPNLVKNHWDPRKPNRVVLGYSKPVLPANPSWWQLGARKWWEDMFRLMARPGYRFNYRDFCSGNVSLAAALFHGVGQFDTGFPRLEDYELGLRLIHQGARFVFEPTALGLHHDFTDVRQWLSRMQKEGVADVLIGEKHPKMRNLLRLSAGTSGSRIGRRARKWAFKKSTFCDQLAERLCGLLNFCEHWRLRKPWRTLLALLRTFYYWRGVASKITSESRLASWLQESELAPSLAQDAPAIDLANRPRGKHLESLLRRGTRSGIRLLMEGIEIATIEPRPEAEPLTLSHLKRILQQRLQSDFVPAFAWRLIHSKTSETQTGS